MKNTPNLPIMVILIDGMRPDGLQQAYTPQMDELLAQGSATFNAQTVMPSISLPCMASLFWGCTPQQHGIVDNIYLPPKPPVADIFDVMHRSGRTTASFYNWEELRDLSRPGVLDTALFLKNLDREEGDGDLQLTELVVNQIKRQPPDFSFLYLGVTDIAGHHQGWMSPAYLEAIHRADRCIGMIRQALPDGSLLVVTADHGGHGHSHGSDLAEDLRIPVIFHGAGIFHNHTITDPVSITDIAPTILAYLDLPIPGHWSGKPLTIWHSP